MGAAPLGAREPNQETHASPRAGVRTKKTPAAFNTTRPKPGVRLTHQPGGHL
eukprot:CAMPEP_0174324792 /NCGR_PEP_ID=MMETSP0810-20121108/12740_1 /TAXON_ID=73025 ORGANISM="Eutreptiella gymnastica-like, Strain CCMP1594" /NCGR_SAMPLE_ID=MMETSP0810 /ASSEMBLY_ACC=CAM_ASM_000659 /LENGTH=51 /DNA_ID=CAMNT_0015437731 /DNA_START=115 /DNA_END=270 /DNA_ORIENTATION=+